MTGSHLAGPRAQQLSVAGSIATAADTPPKLRATAETAQFMSQQTTAVTAACCAAALAAGAGALAVLSICEARVWRAQLLAASAAAAASAASFELDELRTAEVERQAAQEALTAELAAERQQEGAEHSQRRRLPQTPEGRPREKHQAHRCGHPTNQHRFQPGSAWLNGQKAAQHPNEGLLQYPA